MRKVAAVSLGFAGRGGDRRHRGDGAGAGGLHGAAAVLASTCCVAGAYVWMKGRTGRVPPLSMATLQSGSGLVVLAALALTREGSPLDARWSASALGALAYLGWAGSVLAFWLNYWLLARMDTSAMLMMGVAEVPIAVLLGAVILGERLPPGTWLGAACIVASVLLGPLQRVNSPATTTPARPSSTDRSAAITSDAGTTTHVRWARGRRSRTAVQTKAANSTRACPASTPTLKASSARTRAPAGKPSSARTPRTRRHAAGRRGRRRRHVYAKAWGARRSRARPTRSRQR